LIESSRRVVFGLDWGEMLAFKAVATYDTDRAAAQAAKTLEEVLVKATPTLEKLEQAAKLANRKEAQDFYSVSRALLGAGVVRQNGASVELHVRKKLTAIEFAAIGIALIGG
jgi:hypothetical protein